MPFQTSIGYIATVQVLAASVPARKMWASCKVCAQYVREGAAVVGLIV